VHCCFPNGLLKREDLFRRVLSDIYIYICYNVSFSLYIHPYAYIFIILFVIVYTVWHSYDMEQEAKGREEGRRQTLLSELSDTRTQLAITRSQLLRLEVCCKILCGVCCKLLYT
jgi:hypothetical protein